MTHAPDKTTPRTPSILLQSALALLILASFCQTDLPAQAQAGGGKGGRHVTLYVSKLGDNSDGSSWQKAFGSVQAALGAIPDDKGGHRIVVRPDVYVEANLFPAQKGAPGAYNVIEADFDGKLGSGATGWAVIDSGDPKLGFKSVDWWGILRASPNFSGIGWDRWIVRRLYVTGGDGGLMWDLTTEKGAEFTVIAEDCVSLGRAFGGGVGAFVGRREEPVTYRRCALWCLDRWGDACGLYIRSERDHMPDFPDMVIDDCTLVGPEHALQGGNPGYAGYSRVKLVNSRLIVLNFSQPRGTPSEGIISAIVDGKLLHVDIENCTLMGYKVFGAAKGSVGYSAKGAKAYVQYEQEMPEGFERLGQWPFEVFESMLPKCDRFGRPAAPEPRMVKLPGVVSSDCMETTPFQYKGRPLHLMSRRTGGHAPKLEDMYLFLTDIESGKEIVRFGQAHSFGSAFVEGDEVSVFAAEYTESDWTHSIDRFYSTDLKTWKKERAIDRQDNEHLFNTSVCKDEQGYLMVYESNLPVQFCIKFARSKDLSKWERIEGLVFQGKGGEYSACPVIRYFAPYYYMIYLHAAIPGHNGWVSFLARSKDLVTWELSPMNPILEACEGEGVNNSDVDLFEFRGATYVYYAAGDQQNWLSLKRAVYAGPMQRFFESFFPPGAPLQTVKTR